MVDSKESVVAPELGKPAKALVAIWLLFGMLPLFAQMFGYIFLPSVKWASVASFPGLAAGIASAALLFWLVKKGIHLVPGAQVKKALAAIAAPVFGYFLGNNVVVVTGPMLLALVIGQQNELNFTVVRSDSFGSRHCRSPLELEGLPFLFDKLCRVPDDFRKGLAPGTRIGVVGYGTAVGIYAESMHRVD